MLVASSRRADLATLPNCSQTLQGMPVPVQPIPGGARFENLCNAAIQTRIAVPQVLQLVRQHEACQRVSGSGLCLVCLLSQRSLPLNSHNPGHGGLPFTIPNVAPFGLKPECPGTAEQVVTPVLSAIAQDSALGAVLAQACEFGVEVRQTPVASCSCIQEKHICQVQRYVLPVRLLPHSAAPIPTTFLTLDQLLGESLQEHGLHSSSGQCGQCGYVLQHLDIMSNDSGVSAAVILDPAGVVPPTDAEQLATHVFA